MMFALLTFLGSLLLVGANNITENSHCQPVSPAGSVITELLLLGNRYLYAQHRFGPPIFSEKCWSTSYFLSQYRPLENSLDVTLTFYGRKEGPRQEKMKTAIIGNKSQYYSVFHGKEVVNTKIVVTADYTVNYECSGDQHSVVIFTARKHRDEKVIQDAIKKARKIIDLPSPSVNLECDKLVTESGQ